MGESLLRRVVSEVNALGYAGLEPGLARLEKLLLALIDFAENADSFFRSGWLYSRQQLRNVFTGQVKSLRRVR